MSLRVEIFLYFSHNYDAVFDGFSTTVFLCIRCIPDGLRSTFACSLFPVRPHSRSQEYASTRLERGLF